MTRRHRRSLPDLRKRCYEILEQGSIGDRASLTVDRLLIALIMVNLLCVVLQSMPEVASRYGAWFTAVELISLVVFTRSRLGREIASPQGDIVTEEVEDGEVVKDRKPGE